MNKISYRSKPPQKRPQLKTELPSVGSADYAAESAGKNGFLLPGLPDTHDLPDQEMTISDTIKVMRNLSDKADILDEEGLESEADFIDFLITKFAAATNPVSEEERYLDYMFKIYNSDMPGAVEKMKTLTAAYSGATVAAISSGLDKETAKSAAFQSALLKDGSNA